MFQVEGVVGQFLEPPPAPKSHGKLMYFVTVSHDIYGLLAQTRLEILLAKEAEQRSVDGIHPRIDRRLLGNDWTFGHYENIRRNIVEYILTVCCSTIALHTFTNFTGPPTTFSASRKG